MVRTEGGGEEAVRMSFEETIDYLGSPNLMIYYNEQRFNQEEFDRDLIITKESKIKWA